MLCMLWWVSDVVHYEGIWFVMCGEMVVELFYLVVFFGFRFYELSMSFVIIFIVCEIVSCTNF